MCRRRQRTREELNEVWKEVEISQEKLYQEGLEEYPKSGVVPGNLLMVAWVAAGTIGCWFLNPIIAWIYLAFALMMVYLVLRRLVCRSCYYHDRRCALGWGKLAALICKREDISKFSTGVGLKLAPMTYGLLSPVPVVALAFEDATDNYRTTAGGNLDIIRSSG